MAEASLESVEDNINIILCGETGAGKSTLSNSILGTGTFNCKKSRTPVTMEAQTSDFCWSSEGKCFTISVCDTPGCLDGTKNKEEYMKQIDPFLRNANILLFCISKTENLLEIREVIQMLLEKLQGADFPRIIVVLTQADKFVKNKDQDLVYLEQNYNREITSRVSLLNETLKDMLGTAEIPIVVSTKANLKITGDTSATPWLARLLYEILKEVNKTELFTSLVKSHPHLLEQHSAVFENMKKECVYVLNEPAMSANSNSAPGVAKRVADATAEGVLYGGLTGGIALGVPTLGLCTYYGALLGGAVGAIVGAGVGTAAAVSSKLRQKKK